MKGVILAGGTGSRLFPITKVTNKHLLPVGQKPMVFHPLEKLIEAGIDDILIVSGPQDIGAFAALLGSGTAMKCKVTYKVQDQAGGIAEALGLARDFAGKSPICVILGDNIFEDSLIDLRRKFETAKKGALLVLKQVPDPARYGVAELQNNEITNIVEKPQNPKTNLAVTGIYFYAPEVFEFVHGLKPSKRGELEITDVNNGFVLKKDAAWGEFKGWWTDAGTFESLHHANELVHNTNLKMRSATTT